MSERQIVILGAGRHARVVLDVCCAAGRPVAGIVDNETAAGTRINGAAVLGSDRLLDDPQFLPAFDFIVGIAVNPIRFRLSLEVKRRNGHFATVMHPSSIVSPYATIGAGSVLVAANVVNSGAIVGDYVVVNTAATVDHDNRIGDGVHLGPGCRLAGNVTCDEGAFIGTGAVVVPDIRVGRWAIVGAGATVVHPVAANTTVVGCPARPLAK